MKRYGCVLPFVLACSSAPAPFTGDAGLPAGDSAAEGASVPDATPPKNDAAPSDSDAALDPFVPHPPAGATKCGAGAITASSAYAACTQPSMILDYVVMPDGSTSSIPRACNALTVGGGEWQVWCTNDSAYVWASIPITNADVLQDCHGMSLLMVDSGLYESGGGGGNGVMIITYHADGTEIVGMPPADPQIVITSITIPSTDTSGAASLYVAGSLEDSCSGGAPLGPPTVLAGINATWVR